MTEYEKQLEKNIELLQNVIDKQAEMIDLLEKDFDVLKDSFIQLYGRKEQHFDINQFGAIDLLFDFGSVEGKIEILDILKRRLDYHE